MAHRIKDTSAAMPAWFADARFMPTLTPEIDFVLRPTFTTQAPGPGEPAGHPLTLPEHTHGQPPGISTAQAAQAPTQLAHYYRQVRQLTQQRGLDFEAVQFYFWLRLRFDDEAGQTQIGCPWYDHYAAIEPVLDAAGGIGEGPLFDDLKQGWALELWGQGRKLYLREHDPDADPPDQHSVALRTPRAALRPRIDALRERARPLLDFLARELGADVLTSGQTPDFARPGPRA